jgi:hypothetical protein
MKALTIRQPWAWAILHAGKNVENRNWPTQHRGWTALHAAKGMTADEYTEACQVISIATPGVFIPAFEEFTRGAVIGLMNIIDCVSDMQSPWFFGDYGFVIGDIKILTPIPCNGKLNFWNTDFATTNEIRRQLGLSTK